MALDSVLAGIPGYGGFAAKRQMNQREEDAELQRAQVAMGLMAKIRERRQDEEFRSALAASGGDVDKALELVLKSGNVDAAAKLTPLAKMAQERREREETRRGLASLLAPEQAAPQNQMVPGPGASVMAGSGPVVPTQQPAPSPTERRLAHLDRLAQLYATNPTVMKMIEAEKGKIAAAAEKPAQRRERLDGENLVQEEYVNGKWQEVGRGPRFARQVVPPTQAQEPLVPVKEADGRVIYVPRSQAAGREVGGRQTDTNLSKTVQQLGRDLEKANLPTTIAVIENAEKITPAVAKYITGPKASWLPDQVIPPEAVEARQDVAKLFNITLKDRSGAAVTNQELERLREEFGKGLLRTPESLISAVKKARGIVEKHYQSIVATHGPAALDAYNQNLETIGGRPFMRSQGSTTPTAPTPAPTPTPQPANFVEGKVYVDAKGNKAKFQNGKFVPVP